MEKILIKNVRIPDTETKRVRGADILLERLGRMGGRILEISDNITCEDARIIDGDGAYALPAFVDIASDFCQPGYTHRESIDTGSLAAFYGGYSHIMLTPDTEPAADSPAVLEERERVAAVSARCNILNSGALTLGCKGKELCDYGTLSEKGVFWFSDGNFPRHDMRILREAMLELGRRELGVMLTPVQNSLYPDAVMTEGKTAVMMGAASEPASAEAMCVAQYLVLARETGCRIHIRNISTAASCDLIRIAKAEGIRVSASTAPLYFSFTDNDTVFIGNNSKVYPPLRYESDREAVINSLAEGVIDCIESGHIPRSPVEKTGDINTAMFGAVGLQSSLGAAMTYLWSKGNIDIFRLTELMSSAPARILGLDIPSFVDVGCRAFVLADPSREIILTKGYLKGRSVNCPYIGMSLLGEVRNTFIL